MCLQYAPLGRQGGLSSDQNYVFSLLFLLTLVLSTGIFSFDTRVCGTTVRDDSISSVRSFALLSLVIPLISPIYYLGRLPSLSSRSCYLSYTFHKRRLVASQLAGIFRDTNFKFA